MNLLLALMVLVGADFSRTEAQIKEDLVGQTVRFEDIPARRLAGTNLEYPQRSWRFPADEPVDKVEVVLVRETEPGHAQAVIKLWHTLC